MPLGAQHLSLSASALCYKLLLLGRRKQVGAISGAPQQSNRRHPGGRVPAGLAGPPHLRWPPYAGAAAADAAVRSDGDSVQEQGLLCCRVRQGAWHAVTVAEPGENGAAAEAEIRACNEMVNATNSAGVGAVLKATHLPNTLGLLR